MRNKGEYIDNGNRYRFSVTTRQTDKLYLHKDIKIEVSVSKEDIGLLQLENNEWYAWGNYRSIRIYPIVGLKRHINSEGTVSFKKVYLDSLITERIKEKIKTNARVCFRLTYNLCRDNCEIYVPDPEDGEFELVYIGLDDYIENHSNDLQGKNQDYIQSRRRKIT